MIAVTQGRRLSNASHNFQRGRHDEAVGHYFALLGTGIEDTEMLLQLGECLRALADFYSARWCYQRVLTIDSTNTSAREALQRLTGPAAPTPQTKLSPVNA